MLSSATTLFSSAESKKNSPPHEITIEKLKKEDVEALALVAKTTRRETYPGYTSEKLDLMYGAFFYDQVLNHELNNVDCINLVMKEKGHIFGFAKIVFNQDVPVLDKLYLLKSHQRKGYGSELLFKCFEMASERGCNKMWLEAYRKNAAALAFYEKHGFHRLDTPVSFVNAATGEVHVNSDIAMRCDDIAKQLDRRECRMLR